MKKVYKIIIFVLISLLTFVASSYVKVGAVEDEESKYEDLSNQINETLRVDEDIALQYDYYVKVVDGKYYFECQTEDENYEMIMNNIELVNSLVEQDVVTIEEDKSVDFNFDEECFAEFGFTNFKLDWKGFDFSMDRSTMATMALVCLLARFTCAQVSSLFCNKYTNVTELNNTMRYTIFSARNLALNISSRGLNKASILLSEDGSLNSYAFGLISTGITAYVAFKVALAASSYGISTIISTVASLLAQRFLPTYIDCFFMFFGGVCGWYNNCVWKTRWFISFGTTVVLS